MAHWQDIERIAVHVNSLPYHQRELTCLLNKILKIENEEELIREIELGKEMVEAERRHQAKMRGALPERVKKEKEENDEPSARTPPFLKLQTPSSLLSSSTNIATRDLPAQSWATLGANLEEANTEQNFLDQLSGEALVLFQNKRLVLSSVVRLTLAWNRL